MNRIFGLDVMRAVAILLVLFTHGSELLGQLMQYRVLEWIRRLGFFGVEIFFVLSGFLIGGILIRVMEKEVSFANLADFWKRRWYRTLPNYYLFLLINVIGFSLLKTGYEWDWRYLLFLQNLVWVSEGFYSVSWSLAVEEWFYLLFPIFAYTLALILKAPRKAIILAGFAIITLVTCFRCWFIWKYNPPLDDEVRKAVFLRLDSMMFGVIAAYLQRYHSIAFGKLTRPGIPLALAFGALALFVRWDDDWNDTVIGKTFLFSIASMASFCILPILSHWQTTRFTKLGTIVQSVSLWSYSLYLVHIPLLEAILILRNLLILERSTMSDLALFCSWLFLSLLASKLIYLYFEMPMTSLRDRSRAKELSCSPGCV